MSRSLKRHPITVAIIKVVNFPLPPLFRLFDQTAHFLFPFLRHTIAKALRFMDFLLFPSAEDDDVFTNPFDQSYHPPAFSDPGESIFLVPFRWWKEALQGGCVVEGTIGGDSVLYNAAVQLNGEVKGDIDSFDREEGSEESEILLGMKRELEAGITGEEGVPEGGEDVALVSEWMFFSALKWHYDRKVVGGLLPGEDTVHDLFSLRIRLLYVLGSHLLVIKISKKENEVGGAFFRACNIFCSKPSVLKIWDFSGETQAFLNGRKLFMDLNPSDDETPLELHVYGLSITMKDEERIKDDMMVEHSLADDSFFGSSLSMNGSMGRLNFFPGASRPLSVDGSYCGTGALGLAGLCNLGNTCFMNSAIQCLVHTPKLVDYFLGNFRKDLNSENPLGMNGKLAVAFGILLRHLWTPGTTKVAPRMFKSTISSFAPQFSGYNQHDSQEFLAFLLDGLHEDLNRVKNKPYIQAKDEDNRPDEEVADEYWANHLSRNDSIIVDLCQGQYRSKLVCPVCKKLSTTFDPFMYLSLPLPSTTLRKMTLTILTTENLPQPCMVTVPKHGKFRDLVEALKPACSLRDDETLVIAEIYGNSILRILEDPGDSIDLIRDSDTLVAYRLPKAADGSHLVEFIHKHKENKFGIPLVGWLSGSAKGSDVYKEFLKLIKPFLMCAEERFNDDEHGDDDDDAQKTALEDEEMEVVFEEGENSSETKEGIDIPDDFEFYVPYWCSKIQMDGPLSFAHTDNRYKVHVAWPEKMFQDYDTCILSILPEVGKSKWISKLTTDSVSLYKCFDAFLKEEPLGPDDMWFCPNCKEHRQAIKKLDLWRLPEILVIHLKRFSYSRFFKNKLETFVDFPVDDFDLSNYVIRKGDRIGHRYMLYAVSNHYGGMGGGHYTAFTKHGFNHWYEFDDSHVVRSMEEQIKTSAAYVLFYKRI